MAAILLRLFLFLLPIAIFFFVIRLIRAHKTKDGALDEATERMLGNASRLGIFLMVAMAIYVGFSDETSIEGRYVPPHEVEGEIIPGHFEDGAIQDGAIQDEASEDGAIDNDSREDKDDSESDPEGDNGG
jgi:hypothetical protein